MVTGDSSTDDPGPPLLGMVDAAIFLSSPVGLASLLQNVGQHEVSPRLFGHKYQITRNGWTQKFKQLFSL
jgi:hypothetical protein